MADLLTKALLNADVDAKVTTNGANENTGARVNDCLNNIVDTIYANKAGGVRDYVGGIVVLPGDLIQRNGILYYSVATQFTATNWGADVASFTPIGLTPAGVDAAIAAAIPLRYKFTGDGGVATGTIGVNTFPMAVTVTNPGAGIYRFTAASGTPFTVGKTYVSVAVVETTNPLTWRLTQLNSTTVYIEIFDTTTGAATDPSPGYIITIETEP